MENKEGRFSQIALLEARLLSLSAKSMMLCIWKGETREIYTVNTLPIQSA